MDCSIMICSEMFIKIDWTSLDGNINSCTFGKEKKNENKTAHNLWKKNYILKHKCPRVDFDAFIRILFW